MMRALQIAVFCCLFADWAHFSHAADNKTIGHKILELEMQLPGRRGGVAELDRIIAAAAREISASNLGQITNEEERAIKTFEAITRVLRRNGFVHIVGHYPGDLSTVLASSPPNIDCDTGSFIYLAIADHLNLPIAMVEVEYPGGPSVRGFGDHNFVRWQLSNGRTVDWDPNDEARRTGDIVGTRFGFAWSDNDVLGYVYFLRGISWEKLNRFPEAIKDYQESIRLFPRSSSARNNLAWLLVTVKELQHFGLAKEALLHAQESVRLRPSPSARDTLACAYALLGRFDEAIAVQRRLILEEASQDFLDRLRRFERGQNCLDERADNTGHSALQVWSMSPADGAEDVALDTSVTVEFSLILDASSVTTDSIILTKGWHAVDGVIRFAPYSITFIPVDLLTHSQTYGLTVSPALRSENYLPLDGNQPDGSFASTFTTLDAPKSVDP